MVMRIEDVLAADDKVVGRFSDEGTQVAAFAGIPATGRRIRGRGFSLARIVDGRVVERCHLICLSGAEGRRIRSPLRSPRRQPQSRADVAARLTVRHSELLMGLRPTGADERVSSTVGGVLVTLSVFGST